MKRILIAVALMVFSCSLLLTNGRSPSQPGSSSLKLVINEYGTFLNVLNADGTSRFGAFEHGGFRLRYKLKGEKPETVQAGVGAADSAGLQPGSINGNGNSASVTVTTVDGKLVIKNEFTFNELTNQLIIRRTLKNNSNSPLSLEFMEQYLDRERIGIETGLSFTKVRNMARQRVRATGCIDNNQSQFIESPPHDPPCFNVVCNFRQASWVTPPLITEPISLLWKCSKTLSPHEGSESEGAVKEVYFGVGVTLRDRTN